jgi:hypothetical protein
MGQSGIRSWALGAWLLMVTFFGLLLGLGNKQRGLILQRLNEEGFWKIELFYVGRLGSGYGRYSEVAAVG